MFRRTNGPRIWLGVAAALAALVIALPAAAQQTGMVRGKVVDEKGNPVADAKVNIDLTSGVNRHLETKTNARGEFVQIGLQSGTYRVTAEKEKLGGAAQEASVKLGTTAEVNLTLKPGVGVAAQAKNAELKKLFDEGVAFSKSGNLDQAIDSFSKAADVTGTCADCYYNIGFAYSQKKDYAKAETAYKKATEIKADYADAYNGLANIYNAQKKFDQAAEASAKAASLAGSGGAGGGSADALFNQGVILWNAGKMAEAKKQFEAVIAANPNHPEAHYQLGLAMISQGDMPGGVTEFEKYLQLSPDGPHAKAAQDAVAALKK